MSAGASLSLTTLPSVPVRRWTVALVGNPNTGKSTLFNALTGFRQHVANYAGVTVEKKLGRLRAVGDPPEVDILDLPGAYSLDAAAADEDITLRVLLGYEPSTPRPDGVICVVDASNLRRNLFLVSQILELGCPTVVALTMTDVARRRGETIDAPELAKALGVPVIPVLALKGVGVAQLGDAIRKALAGQSGAHCLKFPDCICTALDVLSACSSPDGGHACGDARHHPCRAELLQTLLNPAGIVEGHLSRRCDPRLLSALQEHRARLLSEGIALPTIEAEVRYHWIEEVVSRVTRRDADAAAASRSDRVDDVLAHPVFGLAVFLLLMLIVFQAIYSWASPLMDLVESGFAAVGGWVEGAMTEGALRSLIVDGVIGGVGGVLIFLPQIVILFLFIALLEDCGYMSRAAFVLDRHLRRVGLSGRSFIPLISSFACAVPGILATRVIEDRRSRLITMLVAPLMSCSARLPVYALLISAFIPDTRMLGGYVSTRAVTWLAMYLVGAAVAVVVALGLHALLGSRVVPGLVIELPNYTWPAWKSVVHRAFRAGREFVVNAGTVILACSVIIWALAYYPRPASVHAEFEARRQALAASSASGEPTDADVEPASGDAPDADLEARLARLDAAEAGAYLRQSYLGRFGSWIEPAVRPLGWDWRIGTAAVASFPAREVVVATLATIFNLSADETEDSPELRAALAQASWPDGRPLFTGASALSLMVFFALCCQCVSTLAVIRRETGSWRWPAFTFTYMTALAYLAALGTYQIAIRLG
ncbi:MAG: ferrous iron transport protein B [Planctomycetota bacterium]|nr:MAG: ferrous iron transport protein B [Planctomycetota bacterium]